MGIISPHFYAINEAINYPLDGAATARDDAGTPLPPHIVADLSLRWPEAYGRYAFLGAVTVGPASVAVTIAAADGPDSAAAFAPLAAVVVPGPVVPGRAYALSPQADGVGGWIAFGAGVLDLPYAGRFASPAQSRLAPRCARAYPPPPLAGLGSAGAAQALTGLVRLRAVAPLALAAEAIEIEGVLRSCVVFRLAEPDDAEPFPVPAAAAALAPAETTSVFARFAGPCGGRPESDSCGDPAPIEFLNGVGPDCDGVLEVALAGCAVPVSVSELGVAALACDLGLGDACRPKALPDGDGRLPGDYGDRPGFVPAPDQGAVSASGPVAPGACALDFTGGDTSEVTVAFGLFAAVDNPLLAGSFGAGGFLYGTNTAATRNVATLDCGGEGGLDMTVSAEFVMRPGPPGAGHNACVVAGYQPALGAAGQYAYYGALLDQDAQCLNLFFYDGTRFLPLRVVIHPGLRLDTWYTVALTLNSGPPRTLTATVTSADDPGLLITTTSPEWPPYPLGFGRWGIGSDRAISFFKSATVAEA